MIRSILLTCALMGCAHSPSAVERDIAAARTTVTLFEIAYDEAARRCAGVDTSDDANREHPCRALPEARRLLDKAKQAVDAADAHAGTLADAIASLEQIAEALDAARGGAQ